jgi:hypothetical protein
VTRNIAIAHYDTLHCGVEQGQEVVVTRLTAFRDWFRHRTHTTEFYVGLGMVWSHESEYRTPFLDACTEVFGGWPRPIGDGIFFFHESGAFHMQATPPEAGALNDHNWTTAGTLIPYSALVPGGVPEGKCVIM